MFSLMVSGILLWLIYGLLIGDWPKSLGGVALTIELSLIGIVLATLLGLVVGYLRFAGSRPVRWLAGGYVELLRNIPLLVLIFWAYFAPPYFGWEASKFSSVLAAIVLFTWFRFEWQFALGAIIATLHDVILTLDVALQKRIEEDLMSPQINPLYHAAGMAGAPRGVLDQRGGASAERERGRTGAARGEPLHGGDFPERRDAPAQEPPNIAAICERIPAFGPACPPVVS